MVSGIPLVLGLSATIWDPYVSAVFGAPNLSISNATKGGDQGRDLKVQGLNNSKLSYGHDFWYSKPTVHTTWTLSRDSGRVHGTM